MSPGLCCVALQGGQRGLRGLQEGAAGATAGSPPALPSPVPTSCCCCPCRYTNQNPDEQWRPIFVLRTGLAHIAQSRQGLPDGLSVAQHIAMGPPALTPFVPVYKGLRPEDYPPALTDFGPVPDAQVVSPVALRLGVATETQARAEEFAAPARTMSLQSLFWKARHVQALVMQDFPALAPAFQDAIAAFEQDGAWGASVQLLGCMLLTAGATRHARFACPPD